MQLTDGEIFNNAYLTFTRSGGSEKDLSTYLQEVTVRRMRDEKDNTRMGHVDKSRKKGLGEWSFNATMIQQFGDAQGGVDIDELMWDELSGDTVGTIKFRPFNAPIAEHNPEYSGPATVFAHDIAKGKVGDLLTTAVEFKSSGNLTRDVTP